MAEEDVRLELEAVQAVYGDDCHLVCAFPPHLIVHIKPRTADDFSLQFVEAAIGIQASLKYPEEPPHIYISEMKGIDDCRQAHLITRIQKRAVELTSCSMLVALCEEAVELLSNMNHPEGNCPLCLYPLVSDDGSGNFLPFMKLMSCYHCFHSECMIRLWRWLHENNETTALNHTSESVSASVEIEREDTSQGQPLYNYMNQQKGNCPVCRKVFNAKDIEHVLEYLATNSSAGNLADAAVNDEEEKVLLFSDAEKTRKEKFNCILKLQRENKGLIEPRKDLAILPGMFLPDRLTTTEAKHKGVHDHAQNPGSDSNRGGSGKAAASKHMLSNRRRKGTSQSNAESSRKQWVAKPSSKQ